KRVV
ncbi:hypothetical protein TNIN_255931, partial [Trichonephila inaurata madagascariensis]